MRSTVVAAVALLGIASGAPHADPAPTLTIVGPEEVVFDWSEHACGANDIPDSPARAFRGADGRVQLIASHWISYRMVGATLDSVRRVCTPVMRSHRDPRPAMFDDREWIGATYTPDGRTIYALVHMEYQGNTHPGRCRSGNYFACWHNAITLAVSRDGGRSYRHARPPGHLVASTPTRYRPDSGVFGMFAPSNIVRHRDGYYYALVHQHISAATAPRYTGNCVMRTRRLDRPRSWRAWDGDAFRVRFIDPYRERRSLGHACRPVREVPGWHPQISFNTHLGRYVAVAHTNEPDERGALRSYLVVSTSDDLVRWTPARKAFQIPHIEVPNPGEEPLAYPVVLDPESPSRNFETTGKSAYLYFTRYRADLSERDLVRVPVAFS